MSENANNLVDNQVELHISTDSGNTYSKVPFTKEMDSPSTEKVQEDVTSSYDKNPVMAAVDFTESDGIELVLPYNPDIKEHKDLMTAHQQHLTYHAKINFLDARMHSFSFPFQVPKFEFGKSNPKEKLKPNLKLSFAGALTIILATP